MTRGWINLMYQINDLASRVEADDRRRARRYLLAALCLAIAAVTLAHLALTTALALPDLAARAIAARGM